MSYNKAITIVFSMLVISISNNIYANDLNNSITDTHSSSNASLAFDTRAKKSVPSQQLEPGETPKGASKSEWQSIQAQMSLGKYKAYQQDDGSYRSSNPLIMAGT
ncbi:MAG: hypothetical protein L3J24_12935 [Xanthomonadales bacterium]|nr:hypothetical protein [Xanthomonadales bacterium]